MDMATELKQSLQLFDRKNQLFYQTPNTTNSKEDNLYTLRSSNAQKSTSEKEQEHDNTFKFLNKQTNDRQDQTNQAFHLNSNDTFKSPPYSQGLTSNRNSNASEYDIMKAGGEFNRLLDFSNQESFANKLKNNKRRSNDQINYESNKKEIINGNTQNGFNLQNISRQHSRNKSLDQQDQGIGGNGYIEEKKKSDKFDLQMIVDTIDEEDNIFNNPFDKDQEILFNQNPPQLFPLQNNLINFSRNSSFASSSVHFRNLSNGESQSTKPQNEINLRNKSNTGKGIFSLTDEVENKDKSIDDKVSYNTQKSMQHQKRIKLLNLAELKTINEQSCLPTDDKSIADSWNTKTSTKEERKVVSSYLFNDREPLYQTKESKCYIGSKKSNLVLIKMLDRKKISKHTQENMKIQYKEIIKKLNENKPNEENISQNSSQIASIPEQEHQTKSIVPLLDYFQTKAYLYIVYEYLHKQSLYDLMKQTPKPTRQDDKRNIFLIESILNALEDLQQLSEIFSGHGNLKLENIFYDGHNIKLSDFFPAYQQAKQDINNYDKQKQNQQPSDVRALGIIYLQLSCGIHAIKYTQNQHDLQTYLKYENIPVYICNIITNSLFSETASLSDFRRYVNKNQNRIRKTNGYNSLNVNTTNLLLQTPNQLRSSFQKSPTYYNPSHLNSVQKIGDDKTQMTGSNNNNDQGKIPSLNTSNNDEQQQKTKELTFLKKYSFIQNQTYFDLKINHLKVTKYKLGDELIQNEQEFETNFQIPIFKNTPEEINLRKRKNLTQINYNPKYQWLFISEIDHLTYQERSQNILDDTNGSQYLVEGYFKLFNQRYNLMRCRDKKSKKNYVIKCINIEDDLEFNDALKEIAILKYIEHNIQPGIKVEKLNEEGFNDEYQQTKVDIQSQCFDNTQETQQLVKNYLVNLFREADKEVNKQFQGGIQKFVDAYIVQRTGSEFTFFMIFEDVQFSLKDFILKNASSLEDNPDKEEISQQQIFNVINIVTKQIKQLKRIGIIHNNITPENLLFQNCLSGKKRIIISNFSSALICKPNQSPNEFSAIFMKQPSFSYKYKSPEIRKMMEVSLQEKEMVTFDPIKADIFSLGLCVLELKCNAIIKDSQLIAIIETIQSETIDGDLILYMIHFSSSIRFSDKEVLQYLKEEVKIDKSYYSLTSSPLIINQTKNNFMKRSDKKSFTQILSVQQIHKIQENQFKNVQRNASKQSSLISLNPVQNQQFLQSEQPEFKAIKIVSGNVGITKKDLFQYTEMSLTNFGEISGAVQLLYQAKCQRRLYLFKSTQSILESLEQKYLKSKQKLLDQQKLEYLLLQELSFFRKDIYDYRGSVEFSKRALTMQSKNFTSDLYTAGKLQLNISLLDSENNNSQTIYYLRSALDNYKEFLGNSSPKLVKILTILGDEYALKQQTIDALQQYQECMIITNSLGYQGPFGMRLLDKLGWAFFQSSDYQSSLKFFLKSSQIKQKIVADKDVSLAETYNNLAECYRVLNDQTKAIFYYEQSLSIISEIISENSNKTLNKSQYHFILQLKGQVYNNLGIMYKTINKYEKAIKLFNESYAIKCQIYGSNSIEVSESLYNVAVIYDDQSQHTQAMQIYDQIIQQFKVTKDLDNLVYADCLHNKGICYYNINDFTKGLNLLNEALSIKRKKINNSVSLAITLQNLALVYHKLGQYKKGLQLYEEALKIFVKKLKPDHPYIYIIQENMKQTQRFAK